VGNLNVRSRCRFEAPSLYQADGGIADRFSGQAMGRAGIEAEDVARQMECTDLTPSVAQQLVGTNSAADHLVDVLGRLAFSVNLLILAVGIRSLSRLNNDTELVGRRRNLGTMAAEYLCCRSGDRLGKHFAISSMRDGFLYRGYLLATIRFG
jgi:hypothetical protein